MAEEQAFDQSEIDQLLQGAAGAAGAAPAGPGSASGPDAAATPPREDAADSSSAPPGNPTLGQMDIDQLIAQAAPEGGQAGSPPAQPQADGPDTHGGDLPEKDVEFLLSQAEQALQSIGGQVADDLPAGAKTYRLEEFRGAAPSTEAATIDLIRDVELDLKIELGRTHMYLEDVLKLRKGAVVPLDKLAGDPVDIYVNGRLIARGEVLVLNDNFCVRVAELIASRSLAS
jgi:flagellar motor switch protein FliN